MNEEIREKSEESGGAEGELLTLNETLALLSISKQTLYRMLDRGELTSTKVGRQRRFRRADLQAYLARGPVAMALSGVSLAEVQAPLAGLTAQLQAYGEEIGGSDERISDPVEREIARLLVGVIQVALRSGASDIHLEPMRESAIVRLRIDGMLHEIVQIPSAVFPGLIQRLKVMTEMNVDERRLPQDGRIHLRDQGSEFDLRVCVIPSFFGESAVVRILDQRAVMFGLDKLGFFSDDLERLQRWNHQPRGLILLTGPTGSGKTTTLYSCLLSTISPETKVLTIEDPVEYQIPGTIQVAVNPRVGLSFASALRAVYRQDPDVIMIGELRDLETIEMALQAALTGHLVFSALHTDSTASALQRLRDVGAEPFIIADGVHGIVAQRLVRKLCQHCRQPVALDMEVRRQVQLLADQGGVTLPDEVTFYHGAGCAQCRGRGYRGRLAVYELLEMSSAVRQAFLKGADNEAITQLAVREGMHTLLADGLRKAAEGWTTVEEVMRVCSQG